MYILQFSNMFNLRIIFFWNRYLKSGAHSIKVVCRIAVNMNFKFIFVSFKYLYFVIFPLFLMYLIFLRFLLGWSEILQSTRIDLLQKNCALATVISDSVYIEIGVGGWKGCLYGSNYSWRYEQLECYGLPWFCNISFSLSKSIF